MLGVMPIEEAMDLANEKKLDLVNISPNAKPPGPQNNSPNLNVVTFSLIPFHHPLI